MSSSKHGAVALDARKLSKAFPGVQALSDVDFACRAGRVHALLGENGAGKSTLVGILTGNHTPDHGDILMDGEPVAFENPRAALDHGILAVYQELTILPAMTVLDNVMLGHEIERRGVLSMNRQKEVARSVLGRVGLTGIRLDSVAGDLSLANQQLLEIARGLVRDSRVIILDEPSAVLSGDKLQSLHDVVQSLAESGTAVVYITHLLSEVEKLADDITILRDGRTVSTGPAESYDMARIVREMVGRSVESTFPEPPQRQDAVVLSVNDLTPVVRGERREALDLSVRAGEIVGIAGLVGSGRSRILRSIAGVSPVASGTVQVNGRTIGPGLRRAVRAGVVFVPEERKTEGLVLDLAVSSNVTLTVLSRITRAGWLSRRAERDIFSTEQKRLSIKASSPAQETRQLSGGNQQKLVVGKWLQVKPRVLLLDEPTRGIDIGAKSEIYDLINKLAGAGLAVVIVSSELIEVLGLAHRVLVCRNGSVAGEVPGGLGNEERVMQLAMGAEETQ
jgi:ribose transport system ATP-binding protein